MYTHTHTHTHTQPDPFGMNAAQGEAAPDAAAGDIRYRNILLS